ncbi:MULTISPECIES: phosphotransferase [unclassified Fusibacter]|uniref:phosphotransferase n=1 Tax=unclassified Fusibacter TaxID=2624464 RepID=UPI001011870C|nr:MULTISPECIES: phosphotransferase [unclassified Fusibacter]MCK8058725.1 phosphotransferase [Fusibacter sp. A2]NPE21799.1 phosphotransferase [Fusibacter sp. A1]RXV61371.1 hypothetical protein DWB64_08145 [Fusibacter sp. A1]
MTVQEYFKLNENQASIYKYAPVYKHYLNDQDVIIKRTKKQKERLEPLVKWQEHLVENGIATLTPVPYNHQLHHAIDSDNWVVYPYIQGSAYSGERGQIEKAGELLGRLHKLGEEGYFTHGFNWHRYDDEFYADVEGDIKGILSNYSDLTDHKNFNALFKAINGLNHSKSASLQSLDLPMVDGHWDYKASNLIFKSDGITLIDTDNAGRIPRLFDLALALLLFHTESSGAPNRVFTTDEWQVFYHGYARHVSLTEKEKNNWQDFLLFVYMDEVLWAVSDLEEDEPQRQKDFMKSLLLFDYQAYSL